MFSNFEENVKVTETLFQKALEKAIIEFLGINGLRDSTLTIIKFQSSTKVSKGIIKFKTRHLTLFNAYFSSYHQIRSAFSLYQFYENIRCAISMLNVTESPIWETSRDWEISLLE